MDILDATTKPKYLDQTDLSGLLGKLELKIHNYFDNAEKKIKERPVDLLIQSLHNVFSESKLPKEYFILEYGAPIISNKDIRVENAFSVQQLAYMDTPMLLGIDISKYDYWTEVNSIVKRQSNNSFDTQINNIITGNILHGDTEYDLSDKRPNQFIYQREDGTEFNLLDCATGIRSFAILQMMLKNGFLNKYTLLIIDEPESHLHPQWIVEYARLIVLLNKHIGVKFFIASHNPDMVSAIKYISEKEETDENLNFYLAERDKHSFQYNYRGLGTDIEPIFESFNIALERINHYGTKEGE